MAYDNKNALRPDQSGLLSMGEVIQGVVSTDQQSLRVTPVGDAPGTPSSTNVITVQGIGYQGTATITRANNQTPYTIGDAVGAPFEIINAGPNGGDVLVTSIRGLYNVSALPSGLANWNLAVYNATPPSAIADNSPWTLAAGDRAAFITVIQNIPLQAQGTGTQTVAFNLDNIIQQFRTVGGTSLWGQFITNQAFTPAANGETITFKMRGILP